MTEILVAIAALVVALLSGWFARSRHERTKQLRAHIERDSCFDAAKAKAKEARNAITDAHPDDPAGRLTAMAKYVLGHGAETGDAHGEPSADD